MGRPPIGDKVMTPGERQKRWREKQKIKRLADRIARLQAELRALRKAARERR